MLHDTTMRGTGLAPAAEAAIIQQIMGDLAEPVGCLILRSNPGEYAFKRPLTAGVARSYEPRDDGRAAELVAHRRARRALDAEALGWTLDDLDALTLRCLDMADGIAPISDEDEAEADALAKALGLADDEAATPVILGRCA